jgi:hypothetical protein
VQRPLLLLGSLAVASAIGSGYLVSTGGTTTSIERGEAVLHEDHRFEYGAALGVASIATMFAWFVLETSHRERRWSSGADGGGGAYTASVEPAPRRPPRRRLPGRRSPCNRGWHLDRPTTSTSSTIGTASTSVASTPKGTSGA